MLVRLIVQFSASATRRAYSTAARLITGSMPGMPAHTGHTAALGSPEVESTTGQSQNILERVSSTACTSRPITGWYLALISVVTVEAVKSKVVNYVHGGSIPSIGD